jgi:FkbM family methyltransferase
MPRSTSQAGCGAAQAKITAGQFNNPSRGHDARSRELTSVRLNEDARFIFPSNDEYWSVGVTIGERLYEPEIDWLLRRATGRPYAFIDCGANMGYWTILASSAPYGGHQTVAVEASRANYEILSLNLAANNNRFVALHHAILDQSGQRVRLYGERHYGMSVRSDWHPSSGMIFEEVETITIDAIAERYLPSRRYPALIKIDIEGAEIEAMKGARGMIEEGALLIYEDHGKEPTHPVSCFVLAETDIVVWRVTSDQRPTPITSIEQVAAIKQDARMGYNFFAHKRESPWSSAFAGAVEGS